MLYTGDNTFTLPYIQTNDYVCITIVKQEVAARESDARGCDPDAVDGMMQEVEESKADLLPAAEQMLRDS